MALPCNVFADQTIGITQQIAACLNPPPNLGDSELPEEQFLLVVLDQLQRRAEGSGTGELPTIQSLDVCDILQASRNASCVALNISPPFNVEPAMLKAIILTMINAFNCT